MTNESKNNYLVAVVGAGPAGLYAAKELANAGVDVALLNRDIKPGGLAEYGIYYDKYKMKTGLRNQFCHILESPRIKYLGNVTVGNQGDIRLQELFDHGFQAIIVTVGAQGTKWLGLPGEELQGVYHAKDIVYHYNKLPPFSTQEFLIGDRVALIGVGNVMMDLAHWVIRDIKVNAATAIARRGPAEVKFTKKEMQNVARNLDLDALDIEFERVADRMKAVGQDPDAAKEFILSALPKALEPVSETRFLFDFLSSPTRIFSNEEGQVCGLEVEDTKLVPRNGDTKAIGLGTKRVIDVETVIFCIGDKVDEEFGLPVKWNEFVKNPNPKFPVNGLSYEAYDPDAGNPIDGMFVAGWSREASSGLVGIARKDGEAGAQAVLQYLAQKTPVENPELIITKLRSTLSNNGIRVVSRAETQRLESYEQAEAERLGLPDYKLKTNKEMLAIIDRNEE